MRRWRLVSSSALNERCESRLGGEAETKAKIDRGARKSRRTPELSARTTRRRCASARSVPTMAETERSGIRWAPTRASQTSALRPRLSRSASGTSTKTAFRSQVPSHNRRHHPETRNRRRRRPPEKGPRRRNRKTVSYSSTRALPAPISRLPRPIRVMRPGASSQSCASDRPKRRFASIARGAVNGDPHTDGSANLCLETRDEARQLADSRHDPTCSLRGDKGAHPALADDAKDDVSR